ncbi:uncharacterized protein TNCV_3091371 [Trichonephila clavipes]|uniref:Uncharacterized protein n=1 Tax=Trichonephila clavipes TaxID=2585209 RepID=A0A8X6W8H3_TRICX|nr:uncharacterized protein TNCV_3091371 [Trichonephila clavipes]
MHVKPVEAQYQILHGVEVGQVGCQLRYLLCHLTVIQVAEVAEWSRYRIVAGLLTNWSAVPLKTRRVGGRCTVNMARAQKSSRSCSVVVKTGGCQLRCRPRHLTMVQNHVVLRQKPSCSLTVRR